MNRNIKERFLECNGVIFLTKLNVFTISGFLFNKIEQFFLKGLLTMSLRV